MNQLDLFETTAPAPPANRTEASISAPDNQRYQRLIDEIWKSPGLNMVNLVRILGDGWTGEEFWQMSNRAEKAGEIHARDDWGNRSLTWHPGRKPE